MALIFQIDTPAAARCGRVVSFIEALADRTTRLDYRRLRGELAGEALLADCGHPQWPGWKFLIFLLLTLQLVLAAQQALGEPVPDQRLARSGRANAVRVVRRGGRREQ